MNLEKVILKLKRVRYNTLTEKNNVDANIKICEMQIKIRDKKINQLK